MNFAILLLVIPLFVWGQNTAPQARGTDISGQPEIIKTGRTCVVSALYYDADGVDDLKTCYLRIDHPTRPLTMQYDMAAGQASVWAGSQGADYLSPVSVQRTDLEGGTGVKLKWQFFLRPQWPLTASGINFQVYAEDQAGAFDGWNTDGSSLAYAEAEYGTTIIAHGYQLLATSPPDWVRTMGLAIGNRLGNARVRQLNPDTGAFELISGGTIGSGADWEEILIMDWADESDIDTRGFSEAAADAFVAACIRLQTEHPSPHFLDRIHLIGHSRGAVIISEMAERLLTLRNAGATEDFRFNGNIAEHVTLTFLDAHPIWGDAVANNVNVDRVNPGTEERDQVLAWEGIDLGEEYYQPVSSSPHYLNPDGMPVYAAWNRNLDETITNDQGDKNQISHTEVHAWYHGTIDPEASDDQLAAMVREEENNLARAAGMQGLRKTAISIDRTLWYGDHLGLVEGFAHCEHGGRVAYVDSLTQLDPSVPQEPFYNYKNDALFDGDFSYSGADVTNGGFPAWEYQGGGGSGSIDDEQLTLTATTIGGNRSRTHNWFYVSRQADEIQFYCNVVTDGDATLQINLDTDVLASWALSSIPGENTLSAPLSDAQKGYTKRLTVELTGTPGSGVEVVVDDIHLVFPKNSVTLTVPNGGENWQTGTTQEIAWNKNGSFSGFKLYYSINSGTDWLMVADSISGSETSYLWTIPENPSENCLVRIKGYFDADSVLDQSDALFTISGVSALDGKAGEAPIKFALLQNYPNPFNPKTVIRYSLPAPAYVRLRVFNTLGQNVRTLIDQKQKAGAYAVSFDASELVSGVYLYRLEAGKYFWDVKKMVVLK